jgi:DNA-binding LacI/PurR family transcriptional regulator
VAWVGYTWGSITAAVRWGGTLAGLHGHGIEIQRSLVCERYSVVALRPLLARLRGARPATAVIALWGNIAAVVARLAAAEGLIAGVDFALVGWTTREFRDEYSALFQGRPLPAVTWSIAAMAEVAIARLLERAAHPDLPRVRINVDTKLLFDDAPCAPSGTQADTKNE